MSVSNERLAEIIEWAMGEEAECLQDDMPVSAGYYADVVRLLLSRRSASNTGGVEVKALEWRGPFEAFPSTMWEAETPFGRYEIEEQNASDSPVYELRFNMKVVAIKDGVPEIQECAQADFNQRILSAISLAAEAEPVAHADDLAVDQFAAAMKAKLKWEREERGRSGWQGMSADELSRLLVEHLPKGDPVDVANFCMMLGQNGQRLTHPSSSVSAEVTEGAWNEFTEAHRRHFPYPDGTEIEVTGRDTQYRSDFSKVMRVRSPQWNGHAPYISFWRLPRTALNGGRENG